MRALVIDGSTALSFLLSDERSSLAMKALGAIESGAPAHVPAHWCVEVAHGLLVAERRKRISQADNMEAHELISGMGIVTDDDTNKRAGRETMALARQYGLTIYDAAYLELAIRIGASLATNDNALEKAALASGVRIFS